MYLYKIRGVSARYSKAGVSVWPVIGLAGAFCIVTGLNDDGRILVSWTLCFLLIAPVNGVLKSLLGASHNQKNVLMASFLILSILGYLITLEHRWAYGSDFGPALDDSYYFKNILLIATGYLPEHATFYEYVLACYARILMILFNDITLLDLLPFNWLVAAILISLVSYLMESAAISGAFKPAPYRYWPLLILLGNNIFIDSTTHLYRDGFMLLFYVSCIIFLRLKHYIFALFSMFGTFLIRGANAFVLMAAMAHLLVTHFVKTAMVRKYMFICLLIVSISGLTYGQTIFISLMSPFAGAYDTSLFQFQKLIESRKESILSRNIAGDSFFGRIASFGPLSSVLLAGPFLVGGLSLQYFKGEVEIQTDTLQKKYVKASTINFVLSLLRIIIWVFALPRMLIGLIRSLRIPGFPQMLASMFLIVLFGVSCLSFQPRHSCAALVFVPIFVCFSYEGTLNRLEKRIYTTSQAVLVGGIVLGNLGSLIH